MLDRSGVGDRVGLRELARGSPGLDRLLERLELTPVQAVDLLRKAPGQRALLAREQPGPLRQAGLVDDTEHRGDPLPYGLDGTRRLLHPGT